ncbi:MAG: energy-coupling factor transporter transmembrane protein EcfT [Anaerolineae bacterium]|nr:energy-coupling factor transporter transmembrane protein EcfT [Anaerolineae bacterium]MDH7473125.1 energy-coupling factor transporter transmembrane component T [Anaerolineae bacterium]
MNAIPFGMYVPGDSILHRLDPRVKMGATLLLMVLPFAVHGLAGHIVLSTFLLALVLIAGVSLSDLGRTLRTVFWIAFLMFFLYLFTTPGEPLVAVGRIAVTRQGVLSAGIQIYRLCLLVISASLLTFTTSPVQLAHGLEAMLFPLERIRLPVRELAMVLTIALRFVPTLQEEIDKIAKAQRARGVDLSAGGPLRRARNLVPIFVPVFVSAFRRADELAMAMDARGFRGAAHRTHMRKLYLGLQDLLAALVVLGLALVTIWLK